MARSQSVCLTAMTMATEYMPFQLTTTAQAGYWLRCAVPSSAVHSRYQRRLQDTLPEKGEAGPLAASLPSCATGETGHAPEPRAVAIGSA
jgi:hypothetical protein